MTATELKNEMGESSNNSEYLEIFEIRKLLWGSDIKADVFQRWSQGFTFSNDESSALVQNEGGPCAVIAPVQAYLLKILLSESRPDISFSNLPAEKCEDLLIRAVCNILYKSTTGCYKLVELQSNAHSINTNDKNITADTNISHDINIIEGDTHTVSPSYFHENLIVHIKKDISEVEKFYKAHFNILKEQHGVLLFLYSVMLTKGTDQVKIELSDISEPLIHDTYGYGSQGLINLLLTGKAVAHVWDHEQNIGGLKLKGIDQQSDVGFITLMEQMQYCTVGSYFKNPKNPVWVMASETHLTVLFSFENLLVSPETASESARRIFKRFDPEGNNFISSGLLQDVMSALNLVSDTEYVEIMKLKLDAENLGIILLNAFMDEFFADEKRSTPDTFSLYHYNGLPRSNVDNRVVYNKGVAVLLECDLKIMCSSNAMLTCLQTKWPNIEINWLTEKLPSLN